LFIETQPLLVEITLLLECVIKQSQSSLTKRSVVYYGVYKISFIFLYI